jgi:hypothetical protein
MNLWERTFRLSNGRMGKDAFFRSWRGGTPAAVGNVGSHFSAHGTLGGQVAEWTPVVGKATYPAPWQAWRIALPPASHGRPFELSITTTLPSNLGWTYQAHFVAK